MEYTAKKVDLKTPVVDEIKELLDGAQAVVLADYRGLTVEEDTALRKQLRENGVTYKVYKNTMVKIAIKGTPFEGLADDLEGPTAVAVSKEDAAMPAKVLYDFSKKAANLELKAGIVDGTYYDKDGIKIIATIPGRQELLGKLLGSIQSPIANFARVIKQIAESKEA